MTRTPLQRFFDRIARRTLDGDPKVRASTREALKAQEQAHLEQDRLRAQQPEVARQAAALRRAREVNHFGQRLELSFGLRGKR